MLRMRHAIAHAGPPMPGLHLHAVLQTPIHKRPTDEQLLDAWRHVDLDGIRAAVAKRSVKDSAIAVDARSRILRLRTMP